jgi:hypothetical protein
MAKVEQEVPQPDVVEDEKAKCRRSATKRRSKRVDAATEEAIERHRGALERLAKL